MKFLLALLGAVVAVALAPVAAGAHATLEGSAPASGARLERPPGQVVLRFSEPVEAAFGTLRVVDARGRRVEAGPAFHPRGRGEQVAVRLRPGLPEGAYSAAYRLISADSHAVSGELSFSVGGGPPAAASVDELLTGARAGPVTATAFALARAIQFAAIALELGALVFLLAAWLPGLAAVAGGAPEWQFASIACARRLRTLLLAAGLAGAASAAAALVLQGATATGASAWAALNTRTLTNVLHTRFGTVWGAAALAWLAVAALTLAHPHPFWVPRAACIGATELALPATPAVLSGLGLLLAPLALLPALGGHASFQARIALLLPANLLHVAAISTWLGGLAVLLVAVPAATKRLSPANRTRLLVAVLARFSTLAAAAVTVVLASGIAQAVVNLRTPAHLLDTAYGRAILVKTTLFTALVALGQVNRRTRLPDLRRAALENQEPGHTGVLLRRTLQAEVTLALAAFAAFAATGALAGSAPAPALPPGSHGAPKPSIGPGRLDATEDPHAGPKTTANSTALAAACGDERSPQPDLAAALKHGNDHRVGDIDAADQRCDGAQAEEQAGEGGLLGRARGRRTGG